MDAFYIFLGVFGVVMIAVGIFTLGAFFAHHFIMDAYDEARYDRMQSEWYKVTGYRQPGDPKPYVPPRNVVPNPRPRTPRNRILPGMGALDRALKEGKRGTVMWRAGDRK